MPRPRLALHWKVLIALALGVTAGALVHELWTPRVWESLGVTDPAAFLAHKASDQNAAAGVLAEGVRFVRAATEFLGQIFLRCLRFIAVPVVLFSLVLAVAQVGDLRTIGRVGGKTLLCFAFTLACAVAIAVALGALVAPGSLVTPGARDKIIAEYGNRATEVVSNAAQVREQGVFGYLLNIVPTNPFSAIANAQMLQVVATAFLLGVGLTLLPREKAAPVVGVCEAITEAIMKVVELFMLAAPLAVFCLISQFVSNVGLGALWSVLAFAACVVGGLGLILFLEYPLLMYFTTRAGNRMTPARFFRGMAPAMTVAFSSSSSSATLPVTIQCARDGLKVPPDIVNFVCPMGTTLNMDGTALFQVISVLFLAQLYGVELTLAQHITVGLMAAVVSVGVPGLPSASIIMMAIVLDSVGVPTQGVAIILAVDRVLDMCRTIVNVAGDTTACVVVAGSEGRLGKDE